MKTIRIFVSGVGVCAALGSVEAGDFKNLDFSQPDLTGLQYDAVRDAYFGDPGRVVPGWTITQNERPLSEVWVTEGGMWSPVTLEILDNATWYRLRYDGQFGPGSPRDFVLEQTATIPTWALTLEFVWNGDKSLPSPLFVDGQRVALTFEPLNPASYRADISPWAGQEVSLSFEFARGTVGVIHGVQFTVPEPSTWALLGVGGAGLGWLALRGRKRG